MANGANPLLVIQQNLPPHVADLEAEAEKIVVRLQEIHLELAKCRVHLAVTPALPTQPILQDGTRKRTAEKHEPTGGAGNET